VYFSGLSARAERATETSVPIRGLDQESPYWADRGPPLHECCTNGFGSFVTFARMDFSLGPFHSFVQISAQMAHK
jgi:hypothetical protein